MIHYLDNLNEMSETKSKKTNLFKIKCLECNKIIDSDLRNKDNKRFHLNLLKNKKSIRWEVSDAPKNPFMILPRSQSVLRSSFGKAFGIKEPQTDLHVTTHSTINFELISHEAATDTKDKIDVKPLK